MFLQKKALITFTNLRGFHNSTKPVLASKIIPDWYKKTPSSYPPEKIPSAVFTVKKCMPVFDALTAGYILSTPCDIWVTEKNETLWYETSQPDIIEFQDQKQGNLHPAFNGHSYPKWKNSWAIKTPKGYSCLFIPPMHNPNPWFVILESIVDTDSYKTLVNFPFVLKDVSFRGLIPANTPMVQIIPFKRDNWKMKIGDDTDYEEGIDSDKELKSLIFDRYKRLYWSKKTWNRSN